MFGVADGLGAQCLLSILSDQFVRIYPGSYFWCFADCLISTNQPHPVTPRYQPCPLDSSIAMPTLFIILLKYKSVKIQNFPSLFSFFARSLTQSMNWVWAIGMAMSNTLCGIQPWTKDHNSSISSKWAQPPIPCSHSPSARATPQHWDPRWGWPSDSRRHWRPSRSCWRRAPPWTPHSCRPWQTPCPCNPSWRRRQSPWQTPCRRHHR